MKFDTIHPKGEPVRIPRVSDSEAIALADAYEAAVLGPTPHTMRALISSGSAELTKARDAVAAAEGAAPRNALDGADWSARMERGVSAS
ncbi:hypothetical protein ASD44_17575 [Mesorhizobium sp. Root554]|uniref:hypothetical protein n=1 Tax=unclassified Mesorhizobium TaxID=325217 RepID=UPI0006F8D901|nr:MULTISPECIES: hypothetical protein [unclassified Mesorhizobium]KQZ15660.1 hypothetical protein ASD27_17580 [Mesorhizobium sp. Root1471]KQZ38168.1 hypothetical protein ASD44_17575 [Mesorhizobium sp. Root554]